MHIAPWTRRAAPPRRSRRSTAAPRCRRWRGRARARAAALGTSRRARSPPAPWSGAPAVPPCWPPAEHCARQHRPPTHRPPTHRPPTHRPPTHRPPTHRAAAAVVRASHPTPRCWSLHPRLPTLLPRAAAAVRASHPTPRCWSPHPRPPAPLPCAAAAARVAVPKTQPPPSLVLPAPRASPCGLRRSCATASWPLEGAASTHPRPWWVVGCRERKAPCSARRVYPRTGHSSGHEG